MSTHSYDCRGKKTGNIQCQASRDRESDRNRVTTYRKKKINLLINFLNLFIFLYMKHVVLLSNATKTNFLKKNVTNNFEYMKIN